MTPRDTNTRSYELFTRVPMTWRPSRELPTVSPENNDKQQLIEPLMKRPGGDASIASEVLNLIKQIVGAGVLGIPAGIAAFGNHPYSLIPAAFLICAIGTISAYGFALVGRICHQTNSTSYREAWMKTVGEDSSWMPAWACVLVSGSSLTTFNIVVADTIPILLEPFLGSVMPMSTTLIAVTTFVSLPLCLMKELSSLAPFSLIGILAMVYTAAVMVQRCIFGYYDEGSPFIDELPPKHVPEFGDHGWDGVFSPNCAFLISMLSTSFMAHYNAPKFYWELRNNTLERFDAVVAASFFGSLMLMSCVAFAGFATFGAASQGIILNNYAASDRLMSMSRAAVTLSVMFSFPLAFVGLRDGLFDLFKMSNRRRESSNEVVTAGLLLFIAIVAFLIRDIRAVMSFSGITWGNAVIYIFPSWMVIKGAKKYPELATHVVPATLTAVLGVLLGAVGIVQAIKNNFL